MPGIPRAAGRNSASQINGDPTGAVGITMLTLAHPATCQCGLVLAAGEAAGRHEQSGTILCPNCCAHWARPPSPADALPVAPINPGVPGRSAQREYERRLARTEPGSGRRTQFLDG